MTKIKTREELLNAMRKYEACVAAFHYVLAAPETATAREIWLGCDRPDWLAWFGSRHRPAALEAFAYGCTDRAVRVYAAEAMARAGLGGEAAKLRALVPIMDEATSHSGVLAASEVVEDVCCSPHTGDDCPDFAIRSTRAAADAAALAHRGAYGSVARHAHIAAAYVSEHCSAAEHAERRIQLDALHASVDDVLG